ncbi:MAG: ABC transporter ATP-binding protein, partial [Thermococcus sp.]
MSELLRVEHLTKIFTSGFIGGFEIRAVDDVSFTIRKGEIVSLVGESGSGKTTIGKLILRLIQPTSGRILFEGEDVLQMSKKELRENYYHQVQAVFQDPFASFNPLHPIDRAFDLIFESYLTDVSRDERKELVRDALRQIGLNPDEVLGKFPHQLSGGQLQRILIARALLLKPKLLIADEIVSMLDASTRIDVLNLLGDFRDKYGTSVLFVTHDLALGYYISDTTIIMYRGTIVEMGDTEKVFHNPLHPYTQMLLESVPDLNVKW